MYIPRANVTDGGVALGELIELSPLVQLISMSPDGLIASALPMLVVEDGDQLTLQGHFARPNEHWKVFDSSIETLAIVSGPDAYITPNSYATKAETHQAVPTWNYESVHARGQLAIHDDVDWVRDLVTRLTEVHEASQPEPWKVTDAPEDYLDIRLRGIVGCELEITKLEAKKKLSQDKSDADHSGAVATLASGGPLEQIVAERMERTGNARGTAP